MYKPVGYVFLLRAWICFSGRWLKVWSGNVIYFDFLLCLCKVTTHIQNFFYTTHLFTTHAEFPSFSLFRITLLWPWTGYAIIIIISSWHHYSWIYRPIFKQSFNPPHVYGLQTVFDVCLFLECPTKCVSSGQKTCPFLLPVLARDTCVPFVSTQIAALEEMPRMLGLVLWAVTLVS